jgi:2-polyprenyl-3-methyl-5-hydroxy-6-metoxy-1,4-benzoquinol methylase
MSGTDTAPPGGSERARLLQALGHPSIQPEEVAGAVAASLTTMPDYAAWLREARSGVRPHGPALHERITRLGNDPLLLALMVSTVVPSAAFERLFTALRRALLAEVDEHLHGPETLRFAVALAIQAFLADYAWVVAEKEARAVERLARRLDEELRSSAGAHAPPQWPALVGAYRPLHRLEQADSFAQAVSWPDPIPTLIRIQVREPFEERALRDRIPQLTPVTDEVSRLVRAQYEENPYPRWVRARSNPQRIGLRQLLSGVGLPIPANPSFAAPDVLVAGCGTGLQAIAAAQYFDQAKVLAIDLSLTSLAYACRKTRELGLANIEYAQADILALGASERRFHVIECGGVLHHLADPVAGWRVLTGLLHPGGLMNIGLYSELARTEVVLARDHIARMGYPATADGIRQCRRDLLDLPDDHPLAALRRMRDLFNLSECRDLLFHVQEHRFTLPRIREILDELRLRFIAFNSPEHDEAYRRRFPDDPGMRSLDRWHRFEQDHPAAFAGMYNFLVYKPLEGKGSDPDGD